MDKYALKLLWEGWKVIDDPRATVYIFVGPSGNGLSGENRETIDRMIRDGYIKRVQFVSMSPKDQPGLVLTDQGLKAIGKPTKAESMAVAVSGPDVRKGEG